VSGLLHDAFKLNIKPTPSMLYIVTAITYNNPPHLTLWMVSLWGVYLVAE
jgi:hypothetical protein